jgi:mutator protein MutT
MATIGAFAIIRDDAGRVLLCHRRDRDLWNLPGGRVEKGETPWDAVVREVKEEVNLEVSVERLAGIYAKPGDDELVFSFVCAVSGGEISLTEEADAIEWFGRDDMPCNTSIRQVERILDEADFPALLVLKQQQAALTEKNEIRRSEWLVLIGNNSETQG